MDFMDKNLTPIIKKAGESRSLLNAAQLITFTEKSVGIKSERKREY